MSASERAPSVGAAATGGQSEELASLESLERDIYVRLREVEKRIFADEAEYFTLSLASDTAPQFGNLISGWEGLLEGRASDKKRGSERIYSGACFRRRRGGSARLSARIQARGVWTACRYSSFRRAHERLTRSHSRAHAHPLAAPAESSENWMIYKREQEAKRLEAANAEQERNANTQALLAAAARGITGAAAQAAAAAATAAAAAVAAAKKGHKKVSGAGTGTRHLSKSQLAALAARKDDDDE
jgi:hypothetical protein